MTSEYRVYELTAYEMTVYELTWCHKCRHFKQHHTLLTQSCKLCETRWDTLSEMTHC